MLHTLHIRSLATVSELEVEFGPRLNVLTGETGAGKSVILGAVQLLLGSRAEKTLIRRGADSCEATAFFSWPKQSELGSQITVLLEEAGIDGYAADDAGCGELIIRRVVTRSGSRCYINSSPVALRILRHLGDLLVDIHGPNDHQSLLRPACQLELLDACGDLATVKRECGDAFRQLQETEQKLAALQRDDLSPAEAELLRHQLREIDAAELSPDQEEELVEQYHLLSHARRLVEIASHCQQGLTEGEGAVADQLSEFVRSLQEIAEIDRQRGGDFLERMEAVVAQIQDVSGDLAEFADSLEMNEEELQTLEQRLDRVQRLKRKHGGDLEAVLAKAEEMRTRLDDMDSRSDRIAELEKACAKAREKHLACCRKLSELRRKAAKQLAGDISDKLRNLGFAQSHFDVQLQDAEPGPAGADKAEFLFAPNPGEEMLPLRKIASSGEVSRVMLAVKTVLSAADRVPVLIFDEVDANIGGRVARAVADELAALGSEHQVLCITHLAQIAAQGDRHFEVRKTVEEGRTITHIEPLENDRRVDELSRMMGADKDSKIAREHAAELLAE